MVVGIVEEVGVRGKKGFHCIEELRLILDLPPGHPIRQPRNGGKGGDGELKMAGGSGIAAGDKRKNGRKG